MAKLTLEALHQIREKEAENMKKRDIHNRKKHVIVAMGTAGLEKGAKVILNEFADLCEKKGLDDVIITQTGAVGAGYEPVVQIHTSDLGLVSYGKVEKADVAKIIDQTLVAGKVIKEKVVEIKEE